MTEKVEPTEAMVEAVAAMLIYERFDEGLPDERMLLDFACEKESYREAYRDHAKAILRVASALSSAEQARGEPEPTEWQSRFISKLDGKWTRWERTSAKHAAERLASPIDGEEVRALYLHPSDPSPLRRARIEALEEAERIARGGGLPSYSDPDEDGLRSETANYIASEIQALINQEGR